MQPTTLTFPVPAHEGQAALNRAVAVLQTGGYTVRSTSESEAIGVKRVIPGWAIFLAVVFGLFCLVGLLFLLIKEDREVRASIIVSPDGEAIAVSGSMNSSTVARLRAELEGAYPSPAPVPEMPADPPVDAAPVARGRATHRRGTASRGACRHGGRHGDATAGGSSVSWAAPVVADVVDDAALAAPIIAVPGGLDDVEAYTIARPRRGSSSEESPRLRFDDGTELTVSDLVLVGRDPAAADGEMTAQLVPLDDPTRGLSKTHAALAVVDGRLVVTDRHSTNGTVVRSATGTERTCVPGDPTPVAIGDIVVVGGRQLVRMA